MNKIFIIVAVQAVTLSIGLSAIVYAHSQVKKLEIQQTQIAELAKVIGASGIVESKDGQIIINKVVRVSDIQQDRPNPIPE